MADFASITRMPWVCGFAAPAEGIALIVRRRELWRPAARCGLRFLPATLLAPALIAPLLWWCVPFACTVAEGHRAAWLVRSMLGSALAIGTLAIVHLLWTYWFARFVRSSALELAATAEACLGIGKDDLRTTGESELWTEMQTDLKALPIAWAVFTFAAALPLCGVVLCGTFLPVIASMMVSHWLLFLPRSLRIDGPGRDFPLIERNVHLMAPYGASAMLGCVAPVLGVVWLVGAVVAAVPLYRRLDAHGGLSTPRFRTIPFQTAELEQIEG